MRAFLSSFFCPQKCTYSPDVSPFSGSFARHHNQLPYRGRNAGRPAPPRTDPYVRHYLIRLLPWVDDAQLVMLLCVSERVNENETLFVRN
jgi:hypothetical protein